MTISICRSIRRFIAPCLAMWVLVMALPTRAADQVNVRFSWKLKGEYSAFYVAKEKNYYTENGLTVSLGEGAGAQAALGALIQGQEDAVVLPAVYALTAISKGMPIRLIAIYQPVAPVGFVSRPDAPVRSPKDFEGKSIATSAGDTAVDYLPLFCLRNGIDCDKIKRIRGDVGNKVSSVVTKQVDIASTYINVDPPVFESQNIDLVVFDAAKFGLRVPGLAIVASVKGIQEKPARLRGLLRALDKGFSDSRKDPEAAARMLLASWSGGPSVAVVTKQISKSLEFFPTVAGRPLGWIDRNLIKEALDDAARLAGEKTTADPGDFFTNAMLEPAKK